MTYNRHVVIPNDIENPTLEEDDVYTVAQLRTMINLGMKGWGYPVRLSRADTSRKIYYSQLHLIPTSATHVVWYQE
jgi:hypothetical protein